MASTFIHATPRAVLDAKRHQGILVTESFAQIQSILGKQLSPEHARLFAEPVHEHSGESVDWYTEAPGTPVPLLSLPEEQQRAVRDKIQALAGDILHLADDSAASTETSKQIRGNILRLALCYPGLEYIYAAGDQPILTGWGFDPASAEARPEELIRLGHVMPAPSPTPAATPGPAGAATTVAGTAVPAQAPIPAGSGGFSWLRALAALLAGFLFFLAQYFLLGLLFGPAGCMPIPALSGCSFAQRPLPGGCAPTPQTDISPKTPADAAQAPTQDPAQPPIPAAPALSEADKAALLAERERELSLRRRIDELRLLLAQRAGECPSRSEPAPEPIEEAPPSLAELMPQTQDPPEIPEPPAAPPKEEKKPEPKPAKQPAQKKGEDMRIPESAKKNKDPSFLEGCWDSETGLYSTNTGEPLKVQYCFGADGKGQRIINMQKTRDRCAGPVRASFNNNGVLYIDADGSACNKGGGFYGHRVECRQGAAGKADCTGKESGGKRNTWKARFKRG